MSHTLEVLADAPIILFTFQPGPDTAGELLAALPEMAALLDVQPRPVYVVLDLRGLKVSLEDVMTMASRSARGPGAVIHHPNAIENLFVLSSLFLKLSVAGLASEVYGKARVRIFDTVDAAIAYCAEKVGQ